MYKTSKLISRRKLAKPQKGLFTPLGGASIPAWVTRGPTGAAAILDIDYTNSRQWYNGASYGTEAALLTAAGATSSGLTRTFSGYVDPANLELLTDGDLASGIGPWANANSGLGSVVSGELVLEGNGGTNPTVLNTWTSTLSKAYKFGATYRRGTSTGNAAVAAAPTNTFSTGTFLATNTTTSNVTNTGIFGAEAGSTSYIGIRIPSAAISGTVIGDNFTVKECLPYKGFAPFGFSGIVAGVTPGSIAANAVLLQFGASGERHRARLVYDTTGHLHFIITYGGSAAADIDLGAIAINTAFSVEFTSATNRFAARLNTATSLTDTVGQGPPMGYGYIGRSFTGETWGGTISRVTLFASEREPSDMIYMDGDSYADPAGVAGVSLWASLKTASSRGAFSTGVGGNDLQTEVARVLTHLDLTSAIYVHWDGDANNWVDVSTTMSYYAQLVASLKTSRYIIIPPCRRNNKTTGDNAGTLQIQQAIAATYPNNYYDAQAYLATLANGTTDNADVAAGYIPTSLLQADLTHLLATPMNSLGVDLWTRMGVLGLQ